MYGQGNYPPPRFRSPFHQSNLPPPHPPISYNPPPPHPLTHQAPSGPPPSHYQHNALQPSPSYLPIQGSSPMPPPYSHVSQPMPPPPVFRLPPPPPHPQGQLLYQNSPPLPPMTQLLPAPPPPQFSGFYTSYGQSSAGDAFPPPPPPPPRPASPPPLPPSSPPPTAPIPTTQDMSENMAHMVEGEASGALSLPPQPPKPTNEEVVHNIDVLCKFMVKIGPDFENMARTKEAGNPNFAFLFGGEPGNDAAIGYEYFQWMKRKCLLEKDFLQDQVQNDSSTVSDIDMEDDISQPDTDRAIGESVKESTDKATSLGISPAPSMTGQIRAELAVSTINPLRVLHGGEDDKDSSFTEDVSRVRVSPDAVEHALENNVQGSMRTSMKYSSMIEVSSTLTEAGTAEAPTVHVKHVSPFRLIQGYASDDSEEDDKEKNDEGINSDRISPADMHEHTKFKSTSSSRSTQEVSRMAKEDESLDNLTKKGLDLQDDNCDVQKNDLLGSDNLNLKNQIGKHWLADDAKESVKLDVDEFGRLVRHGASDSDSDEMHVSGRRIKRGRNRSRSRSPPQGSRRRRRSRSPRRRDKRSRSRSWSPKRTTSKSPPVFRRTNVSSRRDRDQPSECFDFNRGRCFRGASCRFLHRDSTRHTSRQHEYSDSARDSVVDRHGASPTFVPGSDAHHKDPKSTEVHAGERINRDVSSSKADNTEPTGRDDIREVQVPDQIVQGVPHMEESEAGDVSEAPDNLNEGKHTEVLLKSFLSHEAEIVVTHVSSGGGTQLSQITQSANISESQGLQGQSQHSHEELAAHPTPSLQVKITSFQNLPPSTHPYLGQTYSDQGLISHPYPNYIPSYPNPSLPPKEFPPPRFLGPNANFQPPPKFPPGPPGPLPIHFPSDKLITQFGSENQNFCPSHRMHITSDYNSHSAFPRNVGWSNIPPPPPLHSVPPKHEFNPMIRPHFHRDEFNRRPLLPNPQDYPFTRDQFAYPPIPEGSQTLSDYQKDYQLRKQSFHPRELSAPAIKDLPFSDHPPPYGEQLPTNSNYTRASMGPSLQHPPSFMDSSKPPHFNPFASTFEQAPTDTELVSSVSGQENNGYHSIKYNQITPGNVPLGGPNLRLRASPSNLKRHADAYDPLFDSIEPNPIAASKIDSLHKSSTFENSKQKQSAGGHNKLEVDEFGEVATDAEAGAVENVSPNPVDEKDWSPGLPLDAGNAEGGEIEIDQGLLHEKSKKCKDSRSMKLFKTAIAEFVKEVLRPSWRQGNMSKEAFKTIVKKTVDKVSGAMKSHQIPRSQAKINQYVESSERKLTKLVMGYVDKYVKV